MSSKKPARRSRKKYLAAWYLKNRKKELERVAAWYRKNRKKVAKRGATYYQKNHKKIAKRAAVHQRKHREEIAKQRAAYRRKNRKKLSTKNAAYRRKNRKKIASHGRAYARTMSGRYRALLKRHKRNLAPRGIKGQPMSLDEHRKKLYFADGRERVCFYCWGENNKAGAALDRLNNSITYTVKNTVPACCGCNVWRGNIHSVQETRDHFKPMRDAA